MPGEMSELAELGPDAAGDAYEQVHPDGGKTVTVVNSARFADATSAAYFVVPSVTALGHLAGLGSIADESLTNR